MAVGPQGKFICIAGYHQSASSGYDCLTAKYDTSGALLWAERYNGEANRDDYAAALCLDNLGNVYVAGKSWGENSNWDCVTIKYDAEGVLQWAARYNAPANGNDEAIAMALDAAGNVYITGVSFGVGTGSDFVTIKYDAAGIEQWVARYNGPGNGAGETNAIAVDRAGHVYVAGVTAGLSGYMEFTIIKYTPAGERMWIIRDRDPDRGNGKVRALAVDDSGYVYIAGGMSAAGHDIDYATSKYNPDGARRWIAYFNGTASQNDLATSLALDGAGGNVYITGRAMGADGKNEWVTIKYNASGEQQWRQVRPTGTTNDYAVTLALDREGGVYVSGTIRPSIATDMATIKYDGHGVAEWTVSYSRTGNSKEESKAMCLDAAGNIYVTGSSDNELVTLKYGPHGVQHWVTLEGAPGHSNDYATTLAIDSSGNAFVAGMINKASRIPPDYVVLKYDNNGRQDWLVPLKGPSDSKAGMIKTACAQGHLYLAATIHRADYNTFQDYLASKLNSRGAQEWETYFHAQGQTSDVVKAIAVDKHGSFYITGKTYGLTGKSTDFATVKYDAAGMEQWRAFYDGPGHGNDEPSALAVDDSGSVYVTGWGYVVKSFRDYVTIKYDSTGVKKWAAFYRGPQKSIDHATALALDDSGNVYVTGFSQGLETRNDYVTVKYNPAGIEQWAARYNGPGNGDDQPIAIFAEPAALGGKIYVTGLSLGVNKDYTTIAYNAKGRQRWVARYEGFGKDDVATAMTAESGASGTHLYVTGWSGNMDSRTDIVTIKYDSKGREKWIARHHDPEYHNSASAVAVSPAGEVYVAGRSYGTGWSVLTILKYTQAQTAVLEDSRSQSRTHILSQNYPNPFNPFTSIHYFLAKPGFVSIKIYNLAGQEVAVLVDDAKLAGEHEIKWQPSDQAAGVYLYRLQVGNSATSSGQTFVQTRKMILLK